MGYIKTSDVAADVPSGVPLIGYDNIVTTGNVTSSTAADGYPVTNLANPATHLKWKAGVSTGDEFLTIATQLKTTVNYLALAKHNFGSQAILVAVEAVDPTTILLHFDGADASTTIIGSASLATRVWTANGNAQLDTAQFKMGTASLLLDGTGDTVTTPSSGELELSNSEFTFDFWIRMNSLAAVSYVFGQSTDGANYHRFSVQTTGQLKYEAVVQANTQVLLQSATGAVVTNTWYHIAVVRQRTATGYQFYLFKDGVNVNTTVTLAQSSTSIPLFTSSFTVGGDSFGASFNGWIDEFRLIVGVARWTATFTPPTAQSGWTTLVNGSPDDSQVMLHFDGADGSTSIADSNSLGSDHLWTANGNAQIDATNNKFGGQSLMLDGVGDWVQSVANSDFNLEAQDFTIDFWINMTNVTNIGLSPAVTQNICGQLGTPNSWYIRRNATDNIEFTCFDGATTPVLTSTSTFDVNSGWKHIAVVRTSSTLKLFIDGVQQASTSFSGTIDTSNGALQVGTAGSVSPSISGWIDEFRLTVGVARWTSTFTPPTAAAQTGSAITDDLPIVFRWTPQPIGGLRLRLRPDLAAPEAAVLYVGELLVLERSITIGENHVPITYGRRTSVVNGMSESGNFMGRIVLGEYRESKAQFEWFTSSFYRSNIDDFIVAAQERPFFWVWSPEEYPAEVGYVWLTNDAQPHVDPVTRRIALELDMRGVA